MKKRVIFTIADSNNMVYAKRLEHSIRYFHDEKEAPFLVIDEDKIRSYADKFFFYRATPLIGLELLKDYETVIKIDADSIVTGNLDPIFKDKDKFDIGCVLNSNPREMKKLVVSVWDIHPLEYMNAGFVVMKGVETITWWHKLCQSRYFDHYQYREQDLLNIVFWYGPYKSKCYDWSDNWYGLVSKGYWPLVELDKDKNLILKKNKEWPQDGDKTIKVIHSAGGDDPEKMNIRPYFDSNVVKRLEELVGEKL